MTKIEKLRACYKQQVEEDAYCVKTTCSLCAYGTSKELFEIYATGYSDALNEVLKRGNIKV
jgi:hypothetical protein